MPARDHYQLEEPALGTGSFGAVWKARHWVTGAVVAIKILHRRDPDSVQRFYREGVVLSDQRSNEYVVRLLDAEGLSDPEPYLVLEFCEFGSLREWVKTRRGWRAVATALLHAAKGLAGLHGAGGLHRDIKPENLLCVAVPRTAGWRVKLADFGIAAFPDAITGGMTVSVMGTTGYIAPELYSGTDFHPGADVYSLGVVALDLLGVTDPRALHTVDAPPALKSLVQAMVAGATARPAAQSVVDMLEKILFVPPVQPPSPAAPKKTNLAPLAVPGTLIAAAALWWLYDQSQVYYDASVGQNRSRRTGRFR
jgi:serine/threonine protein kinase